MWNILPKKVADGELYAKYSLLEAHEGNSDCFRAVVPSASSRFHGNMVSVAVGVATRACSNTVMYVSENC